MNFSSFPSFLLIMEPLRWDWKYKEVSNHTQFIENCFFILVPSEWTLEATGDLFWCFQGTMYLVLATAGVVLPI